MRIVVAACSVTYAGRGDTHLPLAVRAIIIKEDGAVSIHSDFGNKPLNYMGKDNVHSEILHEAGTITWMFDSRKENLQIHLHEVISDSSHELSVIEPGLTRDGTESHLQAWLAANPETFGKGYTLVSREYPTGQGPVDLLVKDELGNPVAVEVKRVAMLGSVDQVRRYVEALNADDDNGLTTATGIIAALDIRPKTLALAQKRGIRCVYVPSDWKDSRFEGVEEVEQVEQLS